MNENTLELVLLLKLPLSGYEWEYRGAGITISGKACELL